MGFKISKNTFRRLPSPKQSYSALQEPLLQPKMRNAGATSDYESDTEQHSAPGNPFADPENPFGDSVPSHEHNTTEATTTSTPTHPVKLTQAEEEEMLRRFALGQASEADYENTRRRIYLDGYPAGYNQAYQRAEQELQEQFNEAFCLGYAKAVTEMKDAGRITAGYVRGRAREAWGEMVDREARAMGSGVENGGEKVEKVKKKGKFRAWLKGKQRPEGKGGEKTKKVGEGKRKAEMRPWFNGLMIPV